MGFSTLRVPVILICPEFDAINTPVGVEPVGRGTPTPAAATSARGVGSPAVTRVGVGREPSGATMFSDLSDVY